MRSQCPATPWRSTHSSSGIVGRSTTRVFSKSLKNHVKIYSIRRDCGYRVFVDKTSMLGKIGKDRARSESLSDKVVGVEFTMDDLAELANAVFAKMSCGLVFGAARTRGRTIS